MAAPRKTDLIADDLLGRIVSGELPVGSVLPKEADLATYYVANRSVVREAVKKLEVHRLVRPVRRRGTEVLDPLASLSPEVLRAMLIPGGRRVEPHVLEELLEVRAAIEIEMNALAALRRRKRDLRALRACVDSLEEARAQPRRYGELVSEMGLVIARATQNRLYEMLVHWHRQIYRELEDLLLLARFPSEAHIQGVRALVDGISRGDVATVRDLTLRYHEWATPTILAAIGRSKEKGS